MPCLLKKQINEVETCEIQPRLRTLLIQLFFKCIEGILDDWQLKQFNKDNKQGDLIQDLLCTSKEYLKYKLNE